MKSKNLNIHHHTNDKCLLFRAIKFCFCLLMSDYVSYQNIYSFNSINGIGGIKFVRINTFSALFFQRNVYHIICASGDRSLCTFYIRAYTINRAWTTTVTDNMVKEIMNVHYAAVVGNVRVKKCWKIGADFDEKEKNGNTALHLAAREGNSKVV